MEDEKFINEMMQIRVVFSTALGRDKLLDQIRAIVTKSEIFEFISNRASKFIDVGRPSLHLVIDKEKALELHGTMGHDLNTEDGLRKYYTGLAQTEIVNEFNNIMVATFVRISEDAVETDDRYTEQVDAILEDKDIASLRKIINGFHSKIKQEDKHFIFSVISSVLCSPAEEILESNEVFVEFLY